MINFKLRIANMVKRHGTSNPYIIAKDLGIDILIFDLPLSVRGYFVRILRRKYIVLNGNIPELGQKLTLCHELGHATLHPWYGHYCPALNTHDISTAKEMDANEFAIHLLSHSSDVDPKVLATVLRNTHPDSREVHNLLSQLIF